MGDGKFVWMNGKIVPWDDATVHVSNHSLHYGSGVFEGLRFYETPENENGKYAIFRLEEHVDRLFYSASAVGNNIAKSKKDIRDAIVKTVKVNEFIEGYIRPFVYFDGGIGMSSRNKNGKVALMVIPLGRYLEDSVKVLIPKLRKTHPLTTDMNAKISGNYQNSILANLEVSKKGYEHCLLFDCKAEVSEGSGENIFFVKNGKLMTPILGNILPGITRDTILKLGRENGFEVAECIINPHEISEMDEAFFCGTYVEVLPIKEITGNKVKKFKTHEVTNQIKEIYMNTVRGKNGHLEWLTFV